MTQATHSEKHPTRDRAIVVAGGLTFGYQPLQPVVKGVDATLRSGRVVALIGPNASGKSTLLKLALGQLVPDAGSVAVLGRDTRTLSPGELARTLAYVPQRSGVSFAYSVGQVVAMSRFAVGEDPARVNEALRVCDLEPIAMRIFTELSSGQQQRVLLARAVAQARRGGAVLLDEPTSAMDLWHVHHTMRLLVKLSREMDLGVLVVLHDINLAARYADEVWLMDDGKIVAQGTWEHVMREDLLEKVYRVSLQRTTPSHGRPIFTVTDPEQAC
ncbi:MAG: ATP-binding cassette domain-containing protein [Phycisphaera sp.]|nr:ATP-binding cassette domain-containing protein [Phycisphaera sp.]